MKGKAFFSRSPALPILALAALLLTLGVVATTPFTLAKYASSATATASGQIAKWEPEVEAADACAKTVFIAHDGAAEWMAVTDGNHLSTARGDEWVLRPNNTGSEVATKYVLSMNATGTNAWAHLDEGGTYTGVFRVGAYTNFLTYEFGALDDTPTLMTPNKPKQEVYLYLNRGFRPFAEVDCYASVVFTWYAIQID